jgi:hypothetical protein
LATVKQKARQKQGGGVPEPCPNQGPSPPPQRADGRGTRPTPGPHTKQPETHTRTRPSLLVQHPGTLPPSRRGPAYGPRSRAGPLAWVFPPDRSLSRSLGATTGRDPVLDSIPPPRPGPGQGCGPRPPARPHQLLGGMVLGALWVLGAGCGAGLPSPLSRVGVCQLGAGPSCKRDWSGLFAHIAWSWVVDFCLTLGVDSP